MYSKNIKQPFNIIFKNNNILYRNLQKKLIISAKNNINKVINSSKMLWDFIKDVS